MASCAPEQPAQNPASAADSADEESSAAAASSAVLSASSAGDAADAPTDKVRTIVCLGDSITYGFGLAFPERDSWPSLLDARLGDGWEVVNLGVSGSMLLDEGSFPYRSTGNIERAKELDADMAIIMLGTNDAHTAIWTPERHREQLRALVREMKGAQGTTDIVLMVPPCVFYEPGLEAYGFNVDAIGVDMRAVVAQVAEEEDAHFVDLYALTEDHPEWFPDQLHPNDDGHRAIADCIYQEVFG